METSSISRFPSRKCEIAGIALDKQIKRLKKSPLTLIFIANNITGEIIEKGQSFWKECRFWWCVCRAQHPMTISGKQKFHHHPESQKKVLFAYLRGRQTKSVIYSNTMIFVTGRGGLFFYYWKDVLFRYLIWILRGGDTKTWEIEIWLVFNFISGFLSPNIISKQFKLSKNRFSNVISERFNVKRETFHF